MIKPPRKWILAPDGDFVPVPHAASSDRPYFGEDVPASREIATQLLAKPTNQPDHHTIAAAMLDIDPSAIIAIYADAKGRTLGTTITRTKNGHTAAAFRSAFRNLPKEAKQVTFATCIPLNTATRTAVSESSDHYLIRVVDCLTIDPK